MINPDQWIEKDKKLERSFLFEDFVQAFEFLNGVAVLAEEKGHHPEIYNVYNKVTLKLCTHDKGNQITEKDISLAEAINRLL